MANPLMIFYGTWVAMAVAMYFGEGGETRLLHGWGRGRWMVVGGGGRSSILTVVTTQIPHTYFPPPPLEAVN